MKKLSMAVAGLAFIAVGSLGVEKAQAVVIDFQSLETNEYVNLIPTATYKEDGFIFSSSDSRGNVFASFGKQNPNYAGSAALANNSFSAITTLMKEDRGAFDLVSMDFSELFMGQQGKPVIDFFGIRKDMTTVATRFTLDGNFGFQTLEFTDFSNLMAVSWNQTEPLHQFDNVALDTSRYDNQEEAAAVPEPTSALGLVVLGALGAGLTLKGRKIEKSRDSSIN
ncbi:PEP-CTERM sorting domain-containing protein [Lyngbya aestuarii]|uniref:PEP-CTERM sorting domain-containing protein n=1 Tax=Lyngbya aestuarii TaxID=118322 RepID=UPI00403D9BF7